jgi:hypothetical protein
LPTFFSTRLCTASPSRFHWSWKKVSNSAAALEFTKATHVR